MDGQASFMAMDILPQVTASDLSFVSAAMKHPANGPAPAPNYTSILTPIPVTTSNSSDTLTYTASTIPAALDPNSKPNYITYETLAEMYGDVEYDGSSEEDNQYFWNLLEAF